MGGDEDDRNPAMFSVQLRLQLEARHPRHADIGDKAGRLKLLAGSYKFFRGLKCSRGQSCRSQQALQCNPHCSIIIDNRDYSIISVNGHSREPSAAGATAQLYVGIGDLIRTSWVRGIELLLIGRQLKPFRYSDQFRE